MAAEESSREIALAINVGIVHLERVTRGIRAFASRHTRWRFLVSPETHYLSPAALEGWEGDGVIALANTEEDLRALQSLACPVVNLSGVFQESPFPRVRPDYRRIGAMAATHLLDRGFRRFGFYGVSEVWYSSQYEAGFVAEVERRGYACNTLRVPSTLGTPIRWNVGQEELEAWLAGMAPPIGVMAAHDPRATMVVRACERVGLRVPEDVAIIGANNDTVACESSRPPLTSVERNDAEIGWRAADRLAKLIAGETVAEADLVVPPGQVRERASTDSFAIEQPDLGAAVRYARDHFRESIGVADLVDASGRSRRWLEKAFLDRVGLSPSAFLARLRTREATRLLGEEGELSLGRVAVRSGFSGTRQLNAQFLREFGVPAKGYVEREGRAARE